MTSNVHDSGQNALFFPLLVNRDIFLCRWDIRLLGYIGIHRWGILGYIAYVM